MSISKASLVLFLAICGLATVLPGLGEAGAPATLNTTLSASTVTPVVTPPGNKRCQVEVGKVCIAANGKKETDYTASLQFSLQSLPTDVTLTVCAIRFVMADKIPAGIDRGVLLEDNGVLLELVDAAAKPERTVAAFTVPPGTPENTAIILRSHALCEALQPRVKRSADQADLARFRLQTTIRDGKVVIFGAAADRSASLVPRLMLTYDRPNALPGDAEWSQIRQDAQRSGRSAWKLYDPDGTYAPTQFVSLPLNIAGAGGMVRGDLRQSPLLYGGRIVAVLDAAANTYRLVVLDRSGLVLSEVTRKEKPEFLAADRAGRLYAVTQNKILDFDVSSLSSKPAEIPIAAGEAVLDVPTPGADGSLYVVSNQHVHAYSPAGIELWRYPTGQDDVGAVTLSADGTTAYVLFGGAKPGLVALDSATGDCRWEQKVPAIDRGPNEAMPIPVAAGSDVLVTRAFPTSDTLYVFHDESRPAPADRGELVPPVPVASCRASAAPNGLSSRGGAGDHIAAAVAGIADDAFHVRGGRLCWSRGSSAEACTDLRGCTQADANAITLLIGDSSGGRSPAHLYGLAAANKQLFFISARWKSPGDLDATCFMQAMEGLGPNLVLGPDGTLYNSNEQRNLVAIVPKSFVATAQDLTLSPDLLATNNDTAFRAAGTISTVPDLSLAADTDIILVAGQKIAFGPGFRVAEGARLRARVGF